MSEPRVFFWRKMLRPRLSLRVLMLGILVFGGGLGWYVGRVRRQAETVAAIRRLGGDVVYVPREQDEMRGINEQPPPVTAWLMEKLGQDAVESVTVVSLRIPPPGEPARSDVEWLRTNDGLAAGLGDLWHLDYLKIEKIPSFTDDHLAHLSGLRRLHELFLSDTALDGKSLRHLKSMKQLERLDILGIPVHDADLANLAGLTNLKLLRISGNLITDEGLQHLSSLKQLKTLIVKNTGRSPMAITSRGLAHLAGSSQLGSLLIESSRIESLEPLRSLSGLEHISIMDASLTDQGLTALQHGFANLCALDLQGNSTITDAGLIHLSGLTKLTSLRLSGTSITGSGLAHLGPLSQLFTVHLGASKLSDPGLAQLDPGTKLFHDQALVIMEKTSISEVGLENFLKTASPRAVFVYGTRTTTKGLAELQKRYGTTWIRPEK